MVAQSTDDNEYEQKRIALAALRHSMLTERVTYSVMQVRLREAAIEQAEEQARLRDRVDQEGRAGGERCPTR